MLYNIIHHNSYIYPHCTSCIALSIPIPTSTHTLYKLHIIIHSNSSIYLHCTSCIALSFPISIHSVQAVQKMHKRKKLIIFYHQAYQINYLTHLFFIMASHSHRNTHPLSHEQKRKTHTNNNFNCLNSFAGNKSSRFKSKSKRYVF